MIIKNCKVYNDGSHYIALPPDNFPRTETQKHPSRVTKPHPAEDDFELAYKESMSLKKYERKDYISNSIAHKFDDDDELQAYVDKNYDRMKRNFIARKVRAYKKVNLQIWNYFCTFTYADDKHTEDSFEKSLTNTLKHAANRKGWKFVYVFERSPENQRKHCHGLFYIPEGQMIGDLIEVKDYSTTAHRMQTTIQNTHFNEQFGRSDFEALTTPYELKSSIEYILKYIEKSGEKIHYGGKLPTYFVCDIDENDVVTTMGVGDKKLLLFDHFTCYNKGEKVGTVSPEVIGKLRSAS
jgi:hypothetical protein